MPIDSKVFSVRPSMPMYGPTTGTPMTNEPTIEPSDGPLATSIAPGNGPPPPPGLLTTAAGTPYSAWNSSAISRVSTSSRSPGGNGTTKVTGLSGYSAWAPNAIRDSPASRASANFFMSPPVVVVLAFGVMITSAA